MSEAKGNGKANGSNGAQRELSVLQVKRENWEENHLKHWVTLPEGYSPSDSELVESPIWTMISQKLHPYDEVICVSADGTDYAELTVSDVWTGGAAVFLRLRKKVVKRLGSYIRQLPQDLSLEQDPLTGLWRARIKQGYQGAGNLLVGREIGKERPEEVVREALDHARYRSENEVKRYP